LAAGPAPPAPGFQIPDSRKFAKKSGIKKNPESGN